MGGHGSPPPGPKERSSPLGVPTPWILWVEGTSIWTSSTFSSIRSVALSLQDGPVAISDVTEDPRIQYPEEAKKEGICSMLSVPIIMHRDPIGALRVYSGIPWEATLEDVNFVQAMAQLAGMALEMCRLYKGLKDRIEILELTRGPKPMDGQKP